MQEKHILVEVRFLGALALYAGARQLSVELPPGSDLDILLQRLNETLPEAYANLVNLRKGDDSFLRVMVNEKLVRQTTEKFILNDEDKVILLPGISGGAGGSNLF